MSKIYDESELYRIDNKPKKKKSKAGLMIIVILEVAILTFLVFTAFNDKESDSSSLKVLLNDKREAGQYLSFVDRFVSNNAYGLVSPLIKSMANHEYLVYLYANNVPVISDPKVTPTSEPQATVSPVPEKIKYYQFSLGNSSYSCHADYDYDISQVTGIREDGKQSLKVGYRAELNYGTLRIINEYVPDTIDIKEIMKKPLVISKQKESAPSILIYHTHTSEGYCKTEEDRYNNINTTTDTELNVVRAGSIISSILNDRFNIPTIHDKTVHDQGYDHNIAYDLSKKTVENVKKENGAPMLTIDIHRDGASVGNKKFSAEVTYNDKTYAQVMFVIGADYDKNNPNPNWEENMKLAILMINLLEQKVPGISRGISMRKDPYNENLADKGLLIEIGFNGNLISDINNTAEILAEVLGEIYSYNE